MVVGTVLSFKSTDFISAAFHRIECRKDEWLIIFALLCDDTNLGRRHGATWSSEGNELKYQLRSPAFQRNAHQRSLASQNDPNARFLLGYLYEHGRGVPRDYTKAAENYEAAAAQGDSTAQNNLAFLYHNGLGVPKDEARAFHLYLTAAQRQIPTAQWNLGHFYYEGIGTPRDCSEAARWFRAAAELGDSQAQYDLGSLYLRGVGVPLDYTEAARWELLGAQQGNINAQTALASFYETGKGLPLDYVAAYAWYSRAIAGGDRAAAERRKSLSHLMTRKQREKANTLLTALIAR